MSSQQAVSFFKEGAVCRPGRRIVAGSCGTPGGKRLLSREESEELVKSLCVTQLCHRALKTPFELQDVWTHRLVESQQL